MSLLAVHYRAGVFLRLITKIMIGDSYKQSLLAKWKITNISCLRKYKYFYTTNVIILLSLQNGAVEACIVLKQLIYLCVSYRALKQIYYSYTDQQMLTNEVVQPCRSKE